MNDDAPATTPHASTGPAGTGARTSAHLLRLSPLLLLSLAPWLADHRARSLLVVLAALSLYAVVLAGWSLLELVGDRPGPLPLVGTAVVAVAGVLAAVGTGLLGATDGGGGTLRVAAGVAAVLGAGAVLAVVVSRPVALAAVLVLVAVVAGAPVRSAVQEDDDLDRTVDRLLAAGIGASYLPEVDGRQPVSARLDDGAVVLGYGGGVSQDGSGRGVGYVLLGRGDLCAFAGPLPDDGCRADADGLGGAGDDTVVRRLDDGTLVRYVPGDGADAAGGVTAAQVEAITTVEARPIEELARLLAD